MFIQEELNFANCQHSVVIIREWFDIPHRNKMRYFCLEKIWVAFNRCDEGF